MKKTFLAGLLSLSMIATSALGCFASETGSVMGTEDANVVADISRIPASTNGYTYMCEDGTGVSASDYDTLIKMVRSISEAEADKLLADVVEEAVAGAADDETAEEWTKLDAPTNLHWSTEHACVPVFDGVVGSEGNYTIFVFRVEKNDGDELLWRVGESSMTNFSTGADVNASFVWTEGWMRKSGTYRFAVAAVGSTAMKTQASDWVWSDDYVYNMPTRKLSYPVGLRWLTDTKVGWSKEADAEYYGATLYYIGNEDDYMDEVEPEIPEDIPEPEPLPYPEYEGNEKYPDESELGYYEWDDYYEYTNIDEIRASLPEAHSNGGFWRLKENSADFMNYIDTAGAYTFTTWSVSKDLSQVYNSDYSPFGPVMNTKEASDRMNESLDRVLAEMDNDPDSALSRLTAMPIDSMVTAIQTDDTVRDKVKAAEDKYAQAKNIDVQIAADGISDRMDTSQISIIGAALNAVSENSTMSLNFGVPDERAPITEDYAYKYKNDIQFSIDLEGCDDSTRLAVPVRITMPVPNDVDADRLCIMHLHHDGTYEEIWPLSISADGKLVSFTIKSFSIFAFGQDDDGNQSGNSNTGNTDDTGNTGNTGNTGTSDTGNTVELPKNVKPVSGAVFAAKKDTFSAVTSAGKINKQVLDFANVASSGFPADKLTLTAVKGSKYTTKQKVKNCSTADKSAVSVKVNKKTGIATVTPKKNGSVEFELEDGKKVKVAFTVETPKAKSDYKKLSINQKEQVLYVSQLFGTEINAGKLTATARKVKYSIDDKNSCIKFTPSEKDTLKVVYQYLNKKYKLSIKIK